MSKTEVSGKQLKDGSVELVDLSPELAGDLNQLKTDVATLKTDVAAKPDASSLAAVATSGSYEDLSNKPSIPSLTAVEGDISALEGRVTSVEGDVALKADASSLAAVATSGSYEDLSNKPSIPSLTAVEGDISALEGRVTSVEGDVALKADASSLAAVATSGSYEDLSNKPSIPSLTAVEGDISALEGRVTSVEGDVALKADASSLAAVATSGSYEDLSNKPSIPSLTAVEGDISALEGRVTSVEGDVALKADASSLAAVATSGSYEDLSNKPSIPSLTAVEGDISALEGRVTSVEGDVALKADASSLAAVATSGSYADLSNKPSLFSGSYTDLTNKPSLFDGTYSSLTGAPSLAAVATSGSYADLSNKPSIPSLTGYATESYVDDAVAAVVNSAPAVLDTLNELAAALGNDENFATTVSGQIGDVAADVATLETAVAGKADASSLAAVATSGSYADLSNKPSLFSGSYTDLTNKPSLFDGTYSSLTGAPSLAAVATSGSYADLSNKPSLFSGSYADLTNKPTLASFTTLTSPGAGEFLKYNGSAWVNSALPVANYSTSGVVSGTSQSFNGVKTFVGEGGGAGSSAAGEIRLAVANFMSWAPNYVSLSNYNGYLDVTPAAGNSALRLRSSGDGFSNWWMIVGKNDTNYTMEFSSGSFNGAPFAVGFNIASTLGIGLTAAIGSRFQVNTASAGQKGVIVRGAASQTANLFEAQNSSGSSLLNIDASGRLGISQTTPTSALQVSGSIDASASIGAGIHLGRTGGYACIKLVDSSGGILDFTNTGSDMQGRISYELGTNLMNFFTNRSVQMTINSAGTVAVSNTLHSKRYTETVANAFNTSLAPSSGTLTVDTSVGNAVLGALSAAVTTWAFTNVPTDNSKVTTVTAVIAGNASYTYGDACSVNGSAVSGGIMWSGGSAPTATANTDIITFIIVKDSAGTVKVFGSATTNFS